MLLDPNQIGDHLLEALDPLALRFFAVFSRFEYALKRNGFINAQMHIQWRAFGDSLGQDFFKEASDHADIRILIDKPPLKQILVNGYLEHAEIGDVNSSKTLMIAITTVRNNLFHGGKFPRYVAPEPTRNRKLMLACLLVLAIALRHNNRVAGLFFEEIPPGGL
jgi:hypothetical protein